MYDYVIGVENTYAIYHRYSEKRNFKTRFPINLNRKDIPFILALSMYQKRNLKGFPQELDKEIHIIPT